MKEISKKSIKKLVVVLVAICFIGAQASTAFANTCQQNLSNCEEVAGNNFNNCINNVETVTKVGTITCIAMFLCPPCIAACTITLMGTVTVLTTACNNTYDTDIKNCEAQYGPNNCHDPVTPPQG
jgi:hypothetical protein